MCIRDSGGTNARLGNGEFIVVEADEFDRTFLKLTPTIAAPVSYTHLRAHETVLDLVCRLLLEKKKIYK